MMGDWNYDGQAQAGRMDKNIPWGSKCWHSFLWVERFFQRYGPALSSKERRKS